MEKYYLSSLDSVVLESVRICTFLSVKHFESGKECIVAELDPPIPGQPFGLVDDISEVVLAARHEDVVLTSIQRFPCFVHVARSLVNGIAKQDIIVSEKLENLAWGELYKTRNEAQGHIFDLEVREHE